MKYPKKILVPDFYPIMSDVTYTEYTYDGREGKSCIRYVYKWQDGQGKTRKMYKYFEPGNDLYIQYKKHLNGTLLANGWNCIFIDW